MVHVRPDGRGFRWQLAVVAVGPGSVTMTPTYLIVGGVAAGMSAATRLRRNDESARIVVVERGGYVSFANCGLPYHLSGVIADREQLVLQTPESLGHRFGIEVLVRQEVTAIDRSARIATVRDLITGSTTTIAYDAAVLATGAAPIRLQAPGSERARSLRDLDDLDQLMADLQSEPTSAVVSGAGFVGLEVAENLARRGLSVTVVELAEQVLTPLDPELAALVQTQLERHGVTARTGVCVTAIGGNDVLLSDGTRVPGDLVVAALGVRPESALARAAGLRVGERGGIVVDAQQRTSDPVIFAVGDVAEKVCAVSGETTLVPLAGPANREGRLVADVITGRAVSAAPVWGTAVVGVFGLTAAVTGWSEKRLRASGRDVRIIHTHPMSHAGYYPGADQLSLKLLVDPESDAILGAQGVGDEEVARRIDVIATAARGQLRASELADLDLAYAPQYGSAKDPVTMLGFIADNLRSGVIKTRQWHEVEAEVAAGAALIDVRSAAEYAAGHLPGALHVPVDDLRSRLAELPDRALLVYCGVGQRGNVAVRMLTQLGFEAVNLDGGYTTWCAGTGRCVRERELVAVR